MTTESTDHKMPDQDPLVKELRYETTRIPSYRHAMDLLERAADRIEADAKESKRDKSLVRMYEKLLSGDVTCVKKGIEADEALVALGTKCACPKCNPEKIEVCPKCSVVVTIDKHSENDCNAFQTLMEFQTLSNERYSRVAELESQLAAATERAEKAEGDAKDEESIRRELVDNICYAGAIGIVLRSRASGDTEVLTILDDKRDGEFIWFKAGNPTMYSPTAYNALHSYEIANNPDHPKYTLPALAGGNDGK